MGIRARHNMEGQTMSKIHNLDVQKLGDIIDRTPRADIRSLGRQLLQLYQEKDAEKLWFRSEIIRSACWEIFHTGHWSKVDIAYRRLYSVASVLKIWALLKQESEGEIKQEQYKRAMDIIDEALLLGSPVMGEEYLPSIAQEIHSQLSPIISNKDSSTTSRIRMEPKLAMPRLNPEFDNIPRVNCPSLINFLQEYYNAEAPIVITGIVSQWPAFSKWSVDYINAVAGCRSVPVEIGARYTDFSWGQQIMKIHQFVERFMTSESTEIGYVAQHELFDQLGPPLLTDFSVPDYCYVVDDDGGGDDVRVNAWFGPPDTISPLHTDPRNNLLAQVFGSKYVRLYDRRFIKEVYPFETGITTNTSQVDVENPDHDAFPLFNRVPYRETILREGELLFIPRKWWHYLRSLAPSFSVSFWFGPSDETAALKSEENGISSNDTADALALSLAQQERSDSLLVSTKTAEVTKSSDSARNSVKRKLPETSSS